MTEGVEGLAPEEVRANTEAVDITDDPGWLAAARWEVTAGYCKLANPQHKPRIRNVYASVCQDGYEGDNRSRTIAALTADPRTGSKEIAGLVRLVFGREPAGAPSSGPAPLDAMNFVRPLPDWPHRLRGERDNRAGELGRFVITEGFRTPAMREAGVDARITAMLFRRARELAAAAGVGTIYGIMPQHASEVCVRAGLTLTEIPIELRTDNEHAARVFEAFSIYWKRLTPRLYEMSEGRSGLAELFYPVLAAEAIVADPAAIGRKYRRNVTALDREVPLVLRPGDEGEVARVVAVANRHCFPLYPFSTGKNWGLGSKLPVADGCVVVDLSRMTKILEVNEEFAYAVLEPGVTQLQLARHLAEHHPSLTLNFTGSFAHTGIVGNVLERGDGAHARVDDLLGVRGILGGGRPFAVGGVWEKAASPGLVPGHVLRYAAGPDLCGLLCQSNFGIVTAMAFRLLRKPEVRYILWGTAAEDRLQELVDTVQRFVAQGCVNPGSVNVGYANRFVQAASTLSASGAPPAVPPAPAPAEWNFYACLGGTARSATVLADEVLQALAPLCAQSGRFRIGAAAGDHDPPQGLPPFLQPLVSPLLGMPDAQSIRLIYRLTGTPLPADEAEVDADQTPFGMKCCIPVVPPRGRFVRRAADLVAAAGRDHGLNVKASFFGDGRTLITIHFHRDDADQVARAVACEAAIWDGLAASNFHPYRGSIDQMQRLVALRPNFFGIVAMLKAALDPNGVIAPGRYCGPTR